jgi:magnesium transporter
LNNFKLENNKLDIEEINFYIGYNFIILVLDESNCLSQSMKNILENKLHIQATPKKTLSRLYYLLFNSIIINTFDILDKIEDAIQNLEDEIIKNTKKEQFSIINDMRHKTRKIVKYIRPLLYIGDQFAEENLRYLNEGKLNRSNFNRLHSIDIRINKLYDFSVSLKEYSDKLLSLYDSGITSKTNDIAYKIALFTGILGSMTVITGIYGMNFKYMPELNWVYGYPLILLIMAFIAIGAFFIFKKKKWL